MNKGDKIKELEKENQHLRKMMVKDELTDTFNRRGFYEKISDFFNEVLFIKRDEKSAKEKRKKFLVKDLSILFIDIDGLKKINDVFGHRAGDEIIKTVSSIMKDEIRQMDFIGRWGGDEFIVALIGSSESDACKVAETIRKAVKKSEKMAAYNDSKLSLSTGVAEIEEDLMTIEDLIERADKAMYEAKNKRNRDNTVKYSEIR